jgi:hypothetical protein
MPNYANLDKGFFPDGQSLRRNLLCAVQSQRFAASLRLSCHMVTMTPAGGQNKQSDWTIEGVCLVCLSCHVCHCLHRNNMDLLATVPVLLNLRCSTIVLLVFLTAYHLIEEWPTWQLESNH